MAASIAQRPNLFLKISQDCPISHEEITDPLILSCNEGKLKALYIDTIYKAIFDIRQATGADPSWYTENGIRFNEAMDALEVPQEIRDKIGPQQPLERNRLLTADGYFNPEGFHIYQKGEIVKWWNIRWQISHPDCLLCKTPADGLFSNAFSCYLKYQDPHRYLTDPRVKAALDAQHIDIGPEIKPRWYQVIETVESWIPKYLLPTLLYTINIHYVLIACDAIFNSKHALRSQKILNLHGKLSNYIMLLYFVKAGMTSLFTGEATFNAHAVTYSYNTRTHMGVPSICPPILLQIFALLYSARTLRSALGYFQLNHRYIQNIFVFQTWASYTLFKLVYHVNIRSHLILRDWLIPARDLAVRCAAYAITLLSIYSNIVGKDQGKGVFTDNYFNDIASVQEVVYNQLRKLDILTTLAYLLCTGSLRTYVNDYFQVFRRSYFQLKLLGPGAPTTAWVYSLYDLRARID